MTLAINVLILVAGCVGALVAIGGDTWKKDAPAGKRVTGRGWISVAVLLFALSLGVWKEARSRRSETELERNNATLRQQVGNANSQIADLKEQLTAATQKLEIVQANSQVAVDTAKKRSKQDADAKKIIEKAIDNLFERLAPRRDFAKFNEFVASFHPYREIVKHLSDTLSEQEAARQINTLKSFSEKATDDYARSYAGTLTVYWKT